ncbi:AraC family transcriptional regulator [Myxococcus sp. K15C18031901]|uniref:AraC family transcriptional regulator n=1 Tax=Myxococcus dinghuensis TaxID=2906761 RepID=UPI0020A82D1B|nr:AraC family transcriptional regulator ligand-binding domain-containing protein [Myxococcus dinghuensis]MCP3102036.1 AraC family transcriptional regulator [Myxococcus dinghuensis]
MPTDLVPVPSVLLDRLTSLGLDVGRVLQHAGLVLSRFQEPKARLTTREFMGLWHGIEVMAGARDIGLRLGAEARAHQLDVATMAATHSPNLGEALQKLARYKRITCPEEVSIDVTRDEARLEFHWLLAEEALPMFLVDATFASTLALARRGTGKPVAPKRVALARRRADAELLTRHFGCKVVFDAPVDQLVFDARLLDEPLLTHNADLLALLVPSLDAALEDPLSRRALEDDVRRVLRRHMSGERPSVDKVAETLHMSSRTLQRRLGETGTSYQRLLDEVRHQAACRLLSSTTVEPVEVAFLLGFEELNSFTRAFQGWEGMTPLRWRGARHGHAH